MRLGVYSFAGSGDMRANLAQILRGMALAGAQGVRLIAFHECALTGYPPIEIAADAIDFDGVERCAAQIAKAARENGLYALCGCAMKRAERVYDAMRLFTPDGTEEAPYAKRALWGWDCDAFAPGESDGVYTIDGVKIGVRVCFEARFPEYFRELYRAGAEVGIVSLCDRQGEENPARYQVIRAHLQTRACENILPLLCVNDAAAHQTAPTAVIDRNGCVTQELVGEGLLVWDWEPQPLTFGERGRAVYNDCLCGGRREERACDLY